MPHFFADLERRITALKAGGADVIRLDIGSPDMPPAAHILEALSASAHAHDHHGYQAHSGTPALRQAWVDMYRRLYGVQLDPEHEVVPVLGSKEGIFHLLMALVEHGDMVLVPDPGYLTYTQGAKLAGGEPYYLPLLSERDYLPDLGAVPGEIARRAKILWLNYPNNPTTATAPLNFFDAAVEFARKYDILVCHDAAYSQVVFDGYRAPSLLQVSGAKEVGVEFNTLSKSHNMAGWRVGAAVGQTEALSTLFKLKTNADSGHFLPVMEAATVALNGDQGWLEGRNAVYQKRRDLLVDGLNALGLPVRNPRASFARSVLENAHVSLTPGTVFGANGEGYMRITITATAERIQTALSRLADIRASWGRDEE
jgi:LL-diaminopimelate aminotransferase